MEVHQCDWPFKTATGTLPTYYENMVRTTNGATIPRVNRVASLDSARLVEPSIPAGNAARFSTARQHLAILPKLRGSPIIPRITCRVWRTTVRAARLR